MTSVRRHVMWPLIVIAIGCLWLLQVAGTFPEAVGDILLRAWPALLVLFGFDVLLGRRRLRLVRWSVGLGTVGLVLTIALAGVVVWLAYGKQADVLRTENVQTFAQTLPPDVETIRVAVDVGRTAVSLRPAEEDGRQLGAVFTGSQESDIHFAWVVEGGTGVLSVSEKQQSAIPKLEHYGRSSLDITLPAEAVVELLGLTGDSGDVTLDLALLRVDRVELAVDSGDVKVHLPTLDVMQGLIKARDGGIELLVPAGMALDVKLEPGSGEPSYRYERFNYDLLRDGELKRRGADAFQYVLDVWLKDGAPLIVTDLE